MNSSEYTSAKADGIIIVNANGNLRNEKQD